MGMGFEDLWGEVKWGEENKEFAEEEAMGEGIWKLFFFGEKNGIEMLLKENDSVFC